MCIKTFSTEKSRFRQQKHEHTKVETIEVFQRVFYGLGQKIWNFLIVVLEEKDATKMCFKIFSINKALMHNKTSTYTSAKISNFPKGIVHAIFPSLYYS